MRALYMATVAACVRPTSMPRLCRRSATLLSETGKRTPSATAKRMVSGLVLKDLNGGYFVICGFYKYTLPVSSSFCLTLPPLRLKQIQSDSTRGTDYLFAA